MGDDAAVSIGRLEAGLEALGGRVTTLETDVKEGQGKLHARIDDVVADASKSREDFSRLIIGNLIVGLLGFLSGAILLAIELLAKKA